MGICMTFKWKNNWGGGLDIFLTLKDYSLFLSLFLLSLKDRVIDLEKGERKRERNIDWLPLHMPQSGRNLQPRHVPRLGIRPTTCRFMGQCSNKLSYTGQGYSFIFSVHFPLFCIFLWEKVLDMPFKEINNFWRRSIFKHHICLVLSHVTIWFSY